MLACRGDAVWALPARRGRAHTDGVEKERREDAYKKRLHAVESDLPSWLPRLFHKYFVVYVDRQYWVVNRYSLLE